MNSRGGLPAAVTAKQLRQTQIAGLAVPSGTTRPAISCSARISAVLGAALLALQPLGEVLAQKGQGGRHVFRLH